ncbi:hypothetical protein PR202_gb08681 [Eleusine coracana subsp. coracana]|uniref:Glycosyl hydrolase family 32 N-terminal domain-containing protein n=1 Tax=Eleusine coracana subsp. coracana TaxID=191504 RepID=A0AAV5EG58_ELECO|nr:hypothetical protein PR202_gb08681 [Eleusine coracana subsp. coracana]
MMMSSKARVCSVASYVLGHDAAATHGVAASPFDGDDAAEPNGPMYYKGWYHVFYQYNPKGTVWGNIMGALHVTRPRQLDCPGDDHRAQHPV